MSTSVFGDQAGESSGDPFLDFSRYVLTIDLTRFGLDEDCYGAGERSNLVQLELTIDQQNASMFYNQTMTDALIANFTFQSFIYTQKDAMLEGAVYKA